MIFFKYRVWNERTKKNLLNFAVHMSRPDTFNDSLDCLPAYNYDVTVEDAKDYLLEWGKNKGFPPEYTEQFSSVMAEYINANPEILKENSNDIPFLWRQNIGVSCFTINPRNPVMWEKYGDNGRGICLCFNFSDDEKILTLPEGKICDGPIQIYPVEYTNKLPHPKLMTKKGDYKELCRVLTTKTKAWEYEQEWRIITIKYSGLAHYKPENLQGIILGNTMPEEHIEEVTEIASHMKTPLCIFQAKQKADNLAIGIEPICFLGTENNPF